jgi:hypothetical protein
VKELHKALAEAWDTMTSEYIEINKSLEPIADLGCRPARLMSIYRVFIYLAQEAEKINMIPMPEQVRDEIDKISKMIGICQAIMDLQLAMAIACGTEAIYRKMVDDDMEDILAAERALTTED